MSLLQRYALDVDFAGIYTIQANGQVLDPSTALNGIPGRLEIQDWGGNIGPALRATLYEGDDATPIGTTSHRSEIAFLHYNKGAYWFAYEIYVPDYSEMPLIFDGTTAQVLLDPDADGVTDDPIYGAHISDTLLAPRMHADFVLHSGKQISIQDGPLPRGRWVKVIQYTYWNEVAGWQEIVCDGRFIIRRNGVQTVHSDAGKIYKKVGIYNYNKRTGFGMARAYYRNIDIYDQNESWFTVLGNHPAPPWQPFLPVA